MTAFLSWLYSQIAKVYDWFGSAYYTLRNAAENAWNWAVQQAQAALSAARSYAYSLLQQALNAIGNSASYIKSWVLGIRNTLQQDISGLFDWVQYQVSKFNGLAQSITASVLQSIGGSLANVQSLLDNVLASAVNAARQFITDNFGWILDLGNQIAEVLQIFTPDRIRLILHILTVWSDTVISFMSDPLNFILDIIRPRVIGFLCYVFAHALGSVEQDIPDRQTWKE